MRQFMGRCCIQNAIPIITYSSPCDGTRVRLSFFFLDEQGLLDEHELSESHFGYSIFPVYGPKLLKQIEKRLDCPSYYDKMLPLLLID